MRYLLFAILLIILINGCKVEQAAVNTDTDSLLVDQTTDTSIVREEIPVAEPLVYRASRTRLMDLIHTRLEISLDWDKQRLNGLATLQLRPYFKAQDKLLLDAKNFDIHHIQLLKGNHREDLDYYYDGLQLLIDLDTIYTREQDIFLEIKYTAKPTEREVGGSLAIESDQGLYFVNPDGSDPFKPQQVWTQGETEANSCWFPTIDSPNERTTQEILITVKDRFTTLSNGELVYSKFNGDSTRTDYWKMDLPHAPYLFMIAVGEFEVFQEKWKDIPVAFYMEKEYAPYSKDIFGNTTEMMAFFSDRYGIDFVWPKYAQIVVRDYVSGAMENTTASLFYEELNVTGRELIDYNFDKIIAHELAHQWFGDLVTCESWSNLALNEGFANYAEYMWHEYKYGGYEADLHNLDEFQQYLDESEEKQVDLIRFYYDDKEDMFDSHSYAKGGLVLNMLREYTGDEAFFEALKRYLQRHQFNSAEVHDVRLAFEEVTGEDLNWFFNQWFLASGHPKLLVEDAFSDSVVVLTVRQIQDLETTPLYKLPLVVEVHTKDGVQSFYIEIDEVEQKYELPVDGKPELVLFDASQKLLAEVIHPKSLEEYYYQFLHTDQFLSRYKALDTLLKCSHDSLRNLSAQASLADDFWYFRQMAVNSLEHLQPDARKALAERLVDMAEHDPKSLVRADVLHTLYAITGDKYPDVFRGAMYDSSYMVAGSGMYLFSMIRPEEFKSVAASFESEHNVNIVIPLASFYIDTQVPDKYNWFVDKLNHAPSDGLWYLLQYFGEYMMKAPELTQRRSIVILENYARNHKKIYVRLAAYQALGLLSDLSGVDSLREDIRNKESDVYLRQLYQSIL